jgi:hypothetical protein
MPKTKLRLPLADSGDHRAWDLVVKGGAILWSRFAEMRSATRDRAGVVKLQKSAMRPGVAGRKAQELRTDQRGRPTAGRECHPRRIADLAPSFSNGSVNNSSGTRWTLAGSSYERHHYKEELQRETTGHAKRELMFSFEWDA